MSQFTLYRIAEDTKPTRAIIAPASLPLATVHAQLRPGERIVWTGNLTDALGMPVTWLDRQRERVQKEVLKAVADLRGRGQVAEVAEDPTHEALTRLFLQGQTWRETCWKCHAEVNPFLERCPSCGASVLPF